MTVLLGASSCAQAMDIFETTVAVAVPVVSGLVMYHEYNDVQVRKELYKEYTQRGEIRIASKFKYSCEDILPGYLAAAAILTEALYFRDPVSAAQTRNCLILVATEAALGVVAHCYCHNSLTRAQQQAVWWDIEAQAFVNSETL